MHLNPFRLIRDIDDYGILPALGLAKKFKRNRIDTLGEDMVDHAGAVHLPTEATSYRAPRAQSEEGDQLSEFAGAFTLPVRLQTEFANSRTLKQKV